MKKQIIAIPVKQISDIAELSAPDGTRQLDFPYYVSVNNNWIYCMINERTKQQELLNLIKEGRVYIAYDINHV